MSWQFSCNFVLLTFWCLWLLRSMFVLRDFCKNIHFEASYVVNNGACGVQSSWFYGRLVSGGRLHFFSNCPHFVFCWLINCRCFVSFAITADVCVVVVVFSGRLRVVIGIVSPDVNFCRAALTNTLSYS